MADQYVKQLDIGEGENAQTYPIKDAEARDLIEELQAENEELKEQITELNSELSKHFIKADTFNDLLEQCLQLDYFEQSVIWLNTDSMYDLTGISAYGIGIVGRQSSAIIDFAIVCGTGSTFITGRFSANTGEISNRYRYSNSPEI